MRLEDLDYDLPEERVARFPTARREEARLLVYDRASGERADARIPALVDRVRAGDVVVVNDVSVAPARLLLRRATGGAAEALVLRIEGADLRILLDARGRIRPGDRLSVVGDASPAPQILLVEREAGVWRAKLEGAESATFLARCGQVPLPPYIRKARRHDGRSEADASDRERYQTVYAAGGSAVAAPTAGLHLTPALLSAIEARGAGVARIRLEVGPGTFLPVRVEDPAQHRLEPERFEIPAEAAVKIEEARRSGGRVLAVGTTVVRTLESVAARADGRIVAGSGETDLLIVPGFRFRAVGALLTNFHLPRSTLLLLVFAFAGREKILELYASAVAEKYRFYSYGDAMLLL